MNKYNNQEKLNKNPMKEIPKIHFPKKQEFIKRNKTEIGNKSRRI